MSEMVRKQIYIHRRQEIQLKRLSKARGVSEADIIRTAIDHELGGTNAQLATPGHQAWQEILLFLEGRKVRVESTAEQGRPYRWNRLDAYEDRLDRWVNRIGEGQDSSDEPHPD